VRGAALTLLMLAGLAALPPAASLAQSAGDEQYVDPFQNQPQGGDQSGSGGSGGSDNQGTVGGSQGRQTGGETGSTDAAGRTTGAAPPAPIPEGADGSASAGTSTSGSSQPTLPATGMAAVPLLLLGMGLLASGVALRKGV
jgi:hypothetical protein